MDSIFTSTGFGLPEYVNLRLGSAEWYDPGTPAGSRKSQLGNHETSIAHCQ